ARALARMVGARDAMIGLGTILAMADDESATRWLVAGAVSDAADAAVGLLWLRRLSGRGGVGTAALALPAAALGAWLARRLPIRPLD
ncbi:MAG: hypothetical protein ACRD0M_13520, partial [Acidimicrobiales bacterium]